MAIQRKIKIARLMAGLTQAELGKKCHISQGMISMFENGRLIPGPIFQKRLTLALRLRDESLSQDMKEG